jgi:hypothetical protein
MRRHIGKGEEDNNGSFRGTQTQVSFINVLMEGRGKGGYLSLRMRG